jgi:hypothetical protein
VLAVDELTGSRGGDGNSFASTNKVLFVDFGGFWGAEATVAAGAFFGGPWPGAITAPPLFLKLASATGLSGSPTFSRSFPIVFFSGTLAAAFTLFRFSYWIAGFADPGSGGT